MIKKIATFAALSTLSLALFATPATAAPAAGTVSWGYWGEGNVFFPDATGTIDGVFLSSNETSLEILNSDDEEEFFVAGTPIGKIFGASPATGTVGGNNFLKIGTQVDTVSDTTLTITFNSEVPAGRLGLAISDIDWDKATITMQNEAGDDISASNIKGKTANLAFNFCTYTPKAGACGSDTDKPSVTTSTNAVIATGSGASTDGSTFWVVPSAAVKVIVITIRNLDPTEMSSTQRIWLAQSNVDIEFPSDELADTGSESSSVLWMASLGMLLAGATAFRFAAKRK